MASVPKFPDIVKNICAVLAQTDGTNKIDLITGGTNGTLIDSLQVVSDDSIAKTLILWLYNGTIDIPLCHINIPASSGQATNTPSVAILGMSGGVPGLVATVGMQAIWDSVGNKVFRLQQNYKLKASVLSALSSTKKFYFMGTAGDY